MRVPGSTISSLIYPRDINGRTESEILPDIPFTYIPRERFIPGVMLILEHIFSERVEFDTKSLLGRGLSDHQQIEVGDNDDA